MEQIHYISVTLPERLR